MSEYPAQVVSVDDPEKLCRVQVRILGMFEGVPDNDLPWATYRLPVGAGSNRGDFSPCFKDDYVWVDFPFSSHGEIDTRSPRITASMHNSANGTPNLPKESLGKGYNHKHSSYKSPYHGSKVSTYHGSTIEQCPNGSVRVFSHGSGSLVEINGENGNVLVYGASDIDIRSDSDISMSAARNIDIKAGGEITANASKINLN